jgi:hypothetical protein
MVESAIVMKDRLVMSNALTNACRSAKNMSLTDESLQDRNAEIDDDLFRDYFADAFGEAIGTNCVSSIGNILVFDENDNYSRITVTLDIKTETDWNGQTTSTVEVDASAPYKFKTPYMKIADQAAAGFTMQCERTLLLRVVN